jgi:hypothetical protein
MRIVPDADETILLRDGTLLVIKRGLVVLKEGEVVDYAVSFLPAIDEGYYRTAVEAIDVEKWKMRYRVFDVQSVHSTKQ